MQIVIGLQRKDEFHQGPQEKNANFVKTSRKRRILPKDHKKKKTRVSLKHRSKSENSMKESGKNRELRQNMLKSGSRKERFRLKVALKT